MTSIQLSNSFKNRIINTHGEQSNEWLDKLPNIISETEARFNIQIIKPLDHLSYNYTMQATQRNGQELIVKFCFPSSEVSNEIDALRFMAGDGIVELIDHDSEAGVILLEKLEPGEMLSTLSDDIAATRIAAQVMQKLWKPIVDQNGFPTSVDWFTRLNRPIDLPSNFKVNLIDKAKTIASELHKDLQTPVLLHGDLHHFNILSSQRQPWLAIDPKGVIGEPEYEVGAFLRNPNPKIATQMQTKKVLEQRVDIFSEVLGFDRHKIIGWAFSQAVLAAVWGVDANSDDWEIFAACALALEELAN